MFWTAFVGIAWNDSMQKTKFSCCVFANKAVMILHNSSLASAAWSCSESLCIWLLVSGDCGLAMLQRCHCSWTPHLPDLIQAGEPQVIKLWPKQSRNLKNQSIFSWTRRFIQLDVFYLVLELMDFSFSSSVYFYLLSRTYFINLLEPSC